AARHLDDVAGCVVGGGDRVGGAEGQGLVALELDRVDGDDLRRPGRPRPLQRGRADASTTDDDDGLPRPDLGGVHRGLPPGGGDAAPDESRLVEGDVLVDPDGGQLVDDDVRRVHAVSAVGQGSAERGEDDVVAHGESFDTGADRVDDAGAFVGVA